jgi:hypothetical protein
MKSIFLVLLFFVPLVTQAQQKQTITLNDGSRISGIIVSDSSDSIKIKVIKPEIVSISKSDVSHIDGNRNPSQMLSKSKGYFMNFSSSILAGKNDVESVYTISFHLGNGYQLSNGLSLGFGVGVEQMGAPLLPIYAEFTFHPLNKQLSPFVYVKSGYSFAFGREEEQMYYYDFAPFSATEYKGGLLFNAGVGLANFTWLRSAVTVGIGYRYQRISETRPYGWNGGVRETVTNFNRIELKFGFLFR